MNELQSPPKNYLVESILATIFCCLPFGIAGIVFASQVNSKFESGDIEGSNKASQEAKKWMKWSIIAWIICIVFYLIFLFAMGGMAMLSNAGQ